MAPRDLNATEIAPGSASITLAFETASGEIPLRVWYHRPAGFAAGSSIVFVMHGVLRNASEYRDTWAGLGEAHGALILAPEFSAAQFPGAKSYNLGNLSRGHSRGTPELPSSFALIDGVFDAVRAMTGTGQERYKIFGHSAGAQFVHRLVLFEGAARIETAVAANAGWYTLPDWDESFPYGLRGLSYPEDRLAEALGRRLIVLAGEADTETDDPHLRKTPEALRQGPNRFRRAKTFFEAAQRAAQSLGTSFAWEFATAPGIGHDDAGIAAPAARLLLGEAG